MPPLCRSVAALLALSLFCRCSVAQSPCRFVALSLHCPVALILCRFDTLSLCRSVAPSLNPGNITPCEQARWLVAIRTLCPIPRAERAHVALATRPRVPDMHATLTTLQTCIQRVPDARSPRSGHTFTTRLLD
jgi:hypothetical protein